MEIQEWVRGHAPEQQFLEGGVVIIHQVPLSRSGKLLRRELRELVKAESGYKTHF